MMNTKEIVYKYYLSADDNRILGVASDILNKIAEMMAEADSLSFESVATGEVLRQSSLMEAMDTLVAVRGLSGHTFKV